MANATAKTDGASAPTRKQYIIISPEKGDAARALERVPTHHQSKIEKNLSSENRQVVTLSEAQVEALRTKNLLTKVGERLGLIAPLKVCENGEMSVPEGEKAIQVRVSELGPKLNVGLATHGADKLHEQGITGKGVTACVIDTGLEEHNDLKGRIKRFYDVFDRREEPPNDGHGHGTHCGGIVGAAGGVTGMAPDCDFIGVKVLSDRGSGSLASVMSGIDKAIEYYKNGHSPMVVSMSLGGRAGPIKDDPVVAKVKEAIDLGITFVVAGGNSGPRAGTIGSPGTTRSAVTVAAFDTKQTVTQDDDLIARFSSVGDPNRPDYGQDEKPNIGANGYQVLSLGKDNTYVRMSGTSMATPFVAGGFTLLMDQANQMAKAGRLRVDPSQVDFVQLMYDAANDHPEIPAVKEGHGEMRVDLAAQLLEERYGGQPIAAKKSVFDRQRVYNEDGTVNYAKSHESNRQHAKKLAMRVTTMDELQAAKDEGFVTRFVAVLKDFGDVPYHGAGYVKDRIDMAVYKLVDKG